MVVDAGSIFAACVTTVALAVFIIIVALAVFTYPAEPGNRKDSVK